MTWLPLVSYELLIIYAILCTIFIFLCFYKKYYKPLFSLPTLIFGGILLLNPVLQAEKINLQKKNVLVFIDKTASMNIAQRQEQQQKVISYLKKTWGKNKEFVPIFINIAQKKNEQTFLYPNIINALEQNNTPNLAGIIFITDGVIADIKKVEKLAKELEIPFNFVITNEYDLPDRRIEITNSPLNSIVDETLSFTIRFTNDIPQNINSYNTVKYQQATVNIMLDGEIVQNTTLQENEEKEIKLSIKQIGKHLISTHIQSDFKEMSLDNNIDQFTTITQKGRMQVLYISGRPYQATRVFRQILKRSPMIDLVHFNILRPPEKLDLVPLNEISLIAFPMEELFEKKLKEFDLIIFDQYQHSDILPTRYMHNIIDYVRGGGAIMAIAGVDKQRLYSSLNALDVIMPYRIKDGVYEGNFNFISTDIGKRHSILKDYINIFSEKQIYQLPFYERDGNGHILANMQDSNNKTYPFIITKKEGKGRVLQILGDQLWIYAIDTKTRSAFENLHENMFFWLLADPRFEEEQLDYDFKNNNIIRKTIENKLPNLNQIITPNNDIINLNLQLKNEGVYKQNYIPEKSGLYTIKSGDLSHIFYWQGKNSTEMRKLIANVNDFIKMNHHFMSHGLPQIYNDTKIANKNIHLSNKTLQNETESYFVPLLPHYVSIILMLCFMFMGWFFITTKRF